MSAANDTLPEAEQVWRDIFRTMSTAQKGRILGEMWHTAKSLHAAGMRNENPPVTEQEILDHWLQVTLEPSLYQELREARRGSAS